MSNSNNEIANQHKWIGDEKLPKDEPHYFSETMRLVNRGETLLENGILTQYHNELYLSALTEFLIITRSLLQKYMQQNKDDKEIKNRCKHIAFFRNGLCHTNDRKLVLDMNTFKVISIPTNYDGSVPWLLKDGKLQMKDGKAFTSEEWISQCDDILHKQGEKELWIKKELVRDFCFARDYFAKKLPSDYDFQVRSRRFMNSYKK